MNITWIGQELTVVESTDPTLIGRSGNVVDETQKTLTILETVSYTHLRAHET